ncbi:hypothetical protein [Bradyrhizobium diazoefficiens]|uniref:hypothetical protein n=1 Tax=Bradyrhizobium diazoefficiens TaxID=1355477 RepID=UPI00271477B0|nr:hypothetical protein [Bradyrhizobium diazoefficiens]WLA53951.1 hypothetical protein QIH81_25745 [Bradyrhizobium diazoefficiens]
MNLAAPERDFLNHRPARSCLTKSFVARLVELGLVEAEALASGEVEYTITAAGRAALS